MFIILGVVDDLFDINAFLKLIIQSIIIIFLILNLNFYISYVGDLAGYKIELGNLSFIFTFFCLLTIVNAFNFIDGVDGICATSFILSILNIIFKFLNLNIQLKYLKFFTFIFILVYFSFKF